MIFLCEINNFIPTGFFIIDSLYNYFVLKSYA